MKYKNSQKRGFYKPVLVLQPVIPKESLVGEDIQSIIKNHVEMKEGAVLDEIYYFLAVQAKEGAFFYGLDFLEEGQIICGLYFLSYEMADNTLWRIEEVDYYNINNFFNEFIFDLSEMPAYSLKEIVNHLGENCIKDLKELSCCNSPVKNFNNFRDLKEKIKNVN